MLAETLKTGHLEGICNDKPFSDDEMSFLVAPFGNAALGTVRFFSFLVPLGTLGAILYLVMNHSLLSELNTLHSSSEP